MVTLYSRTTSMIILNAYGFLGSIRHIFFEKKKRRFLMSTKCVSVFTKNIILFVSETHLLVSWKIVCFIVIEEIRFFPFYWQEILFMVCSRSLCCLGDINETYVCYVFGRINSAFRFNTREVMLCDFPGALVSVQL